MSRQRIGSAQKTVLHVLSAYGLTAETDVQHWATVASVAEMGNMTLRPRGVHSAVYNAPAS